MSIQMKTIHKVVLELSAAQTIQLPICSRILTAQVQFPGDICLWYECDPEAEKECRHFVIVGTGHKIPDTHRLNYIATVQQGAFVWHIYEALK